MTRKYKFPHKLLKKLNQNITQNHPLSIGRKIREAKSWTTSTYCNSHIRKITNLFRHTNVGRAVRNTSTFQRLAQPKIKLQITEHE
jgi:hypothetical protein